MKLLPLCFLLSSCMAVSEKGMVTVGGKGAAKGNGWVAVFNHENSYSDTTNLIGTGLMWNAMGPMISGAANALVKGTKNPNIIPKDPNIIPVDPNVIPVNPNIVPQ